MQPINFIDASEFCIRFFMFYTDVDECSDGTDNCHTEASCTNNDGGFDCTCNSGYSGNGVTCSGKFILIDVTHVFTRHNLYLLIQIL